MLHCSKSFIYESGINDKGDANRRRGEKIESGIAWMELLLPTLDRMPDENWYLVSAPDRQTVAGWYADDSQRFPGIFKPLQTNTFLKIWRAYLSEIVRLRKYRRFAKCKDCIRLRAEKLERHGDLDARSLNKRKLNHQYILIKRYRGRALKHAYQAAIHDTRYLSSTQDATEQLGYG
jgi:hypothetical protein